MSKPKFKKAYTFRESSSDSKEEITELIDEIKNSQKMLSKLMNLEAWALAETMDRYIPGFWNRFLENRRQALKQFLEYKRNLKNKHNDDWEAFFALNEENSLEEIAKTMEEEI